MTRVAFSMMFPKGSKAWRIRLSRNFMHKFPSALGRKLVTVIVEGLLLDRVEVIYFWISLMNRVFDGMANYAESLLSQIIRGISAHYIIIDVNQFNYELSREIKCLSFW